MKRIKSRKYRRDKTMFGPIFYGGSCWYVGGPDYVFRGGSGQSMEVGPFRTLASAIECLRNYRRGNINSFRKREKKNDG